MSWRRRRRHAEPAADEFLARPFVVPTDVRVGADDEHGMFLTAFTSEQALREFAPESEAPVPFNGSNVLHFLLETDCSGVVIDPGGPESFVVDRATAEAVAGPSYEALWEGSKVMLARPDEPLPASVVEALRGACARDGDVVAAYAFLAAAPGREEHPQACSGSNSRPRPSSAKPRSQRCRPAFSHRKRRPSGSAAGRTWTSGFSTTTSWSRFATRSGSRCIGAPTTKSESRRRRPAPTLSRTGRAGPS